MSTSLPPGRGEVARLVQAQDWASTPLGESTRWPPALLTVAGVMFNAARPMCVAWGPQLALLYNDAFRPLLGDRHPAALGRPLREAWPEAWPCIGRLHEQALAGEAARADDVECTIRRDGVEVQSWFDVSCSPVHEGDQVAGVLCLIDETTGRVLADRDRHDEYRRLQQWFAQAPNLLAVLRGPQHVIEVANKAVHELTSHSDMVGLTVREALPDLEGQGYIGLLDEVYRSGIPFVGRSMAVQFRRRRQAPLEDRLFDFVFQPIRDDADRVVGIFFSAVDVTESAQAAAALRASERKLRAATEGAGVGTWDLDLVTGRGSWSERGEALMGLGRREFTATDWDEALHPDDRPAVQAAWQEAMAHNRPYEVETRTLATAEDGGPRWVLGRGMFEQDASGQAIAACGVLLDVTERHRAQEAARQAQEALRTAEESMQLAMQIGAAGTWDWDMVSGRLQWSRSRFEVLGMEPTPTGEASMEVWLNSIPPEDVPALQAEWQRALAAHDVFRSEHRYRRVDGRLIWVSAAGRFFYGDDGEPVRFVGVFFDISRRRKAEEALRNADRRKDEFLATLAHELRNPMAPIRNGLAILRVPGLEPGTRGRMLELMERQVQHMVRLVDDLLEVSRITRGKIELRREVVELRSVVRASLEGQQPQFHAAQHEVRVDLPPQPVLVDADPTRMAQVVDNLLNNACKYTPDGGRVRIGLHVEGDQAVLAVQDNGTGIPADMLDRVFDLFTQIDRTLGRAKGGLGIGLALVQQLVRMHGGTVQAQSEGIGAGARFTVRLPLLAADTGPGAAGGAPELAAAAQPLRVLVVDDNHDAADSLALLLEAGGHQARTAYDGFEALRAVPEFRPRWVLLDIGMPGMDGHAVARALRERPGGEQLRLVAVTGWGQADDRRLTQASGFDAHLVKPVEPGTLLRLLEQDELANPV
ncbi:hybrid sensor histidine kinase/response regulator [Ramlibacter sp.]|uniref:hybrid sensor histidine kinase/response regulator n=1 Tax=Ramlibacter sp. TaxID=1917967 RepID=UPI002FCA6672